MDLLRKKKSLVALAAIAGILAAVTIPAYQKATRIAEIVNAYSIGQQASAKVEAYLGAHGRIPTLTEAGIDGKPAQVRSVTIDPANGVLRVVSNIDGSAGPGVLVFEPSLDTNGKVSWTCRGEGMAASALPLKCR